MPENTENQVNTGQYDDTTDFNCPFNRQILVLHSYQLNGWCPILGIWHATIHHDFRINGFSSASLNVLFSYLGYDPIM